MGYKGRTLLSGGIFYMGPYPIIKMRVGVRAVKTPMQYKKYSPLYHLIRLSRIFHPSLPCPAKNGG